MSTRSEPGDGPGLDAVMSERRRLINLGYRLLGSLVEAEDVVQDERDALGRRHGVEHDEKGHVDRLVEGDPVGRIDGLVRPPGERVR